MSKLIYSGSGANAPEEFLYEVDGGIVKPFAHGLKDKMLFLTIGRDLKSLCGIVIEGKENHLFKLDLSNNSLEKIITINNNAIYYPILSPSGNKIAFLETPNKSYPPMRDDEALIKILTKTSSGWKLTPYEGKTLLDPFDWAEDDESILYPNDEGKLIKENISNNNKTILAENIFYPRVSHNGKILAYYNGEAIIIEQNQQKTICKIIEDAQYVFFAPTDDAVYYIAPSAFWKMAVFKIPLNNTAANPEKVFETSEITFSAIV